MNGENSQMNNMILLVSGDQQMLNQTFFFIKQLEFSDAEQRVTLCRNGDQAFKLFQDKKNWNRYGLIISDCHASILNGLDMTQKIKALLQEVGVAEGK